MKFLLYLLYPLTLIYQFGFYLDRKFKKKRTLENSFTISVGNLTMGGTGKTPVTIYLSKLLSSIFFEHDIIVLSRGYRGKATDEGMQVELNSNPEISGDEPLLIKTKAPNTIVIVGKDRYSSFHKFYPIKKIENKIVHFQNINSRFSPRFRSIYKSRFFLPKLETTETIKLEEDIQKKIVILDDGFQHHAIKRNLDFLLVDSDNALGTGFTIPLGNLREKITAVKRVQYIFFTRYTKENSYNVEILKMKFLKLNPNLKFFHLAYIFDTLKNSKNESLSINEIKKKKVTAFSALGNPFSFENTIENLKPIELKIKRFTDHFLYDEKTIEEMILKLANDEILICTEKDFIKIKNLKLSEEQFSKIYFLPVEVFINKHFELKQDLERIINNYFYEMKSQRIQKLDTKI